MLTRKIYVILLLVTVMSCILTLVTAYGYTLSRFAKVIPVPKTYKPYPNYRSIYFKQISYVKVIGNVSSNEPGTYCIDLSSYVRNIPQIRRILNRLERAGFIIDFNVELCTESSRPKTIVYLNNVKYMLNSTGFLRLADVGGKVVRILNIEGANTYLKIYVLAIDWYSVFEGQTYITLSEAKTYIGKSGLLKGYVFTTASYPLDILDLVLAVVNKYSGYDFWGLITRELLLRLIVLDYILLVGSIGYKTRTISGACLGNICVVCNSSWSLFNSLKNLEEALMNPTKLIRGLYSSSSTCKIVNITSGKIVPINQTTNLTILIKEVYCGLEHSQKISLIIPSCNKYWCIVGFEENYPVKELDLKNVHSRVFVFYTLIPEKTFVKISKLYNVTLAAYEYAYVYYNYTHSILVQPIVEIEEPYLSNSTIKYRIVTKTVSLSPLAAYIEENNTPIYKAGLTYTIYNIKNGENVDIVLPIEFNIYHNLTVNSMLFRVKYLCTFNNVNIGTPNVSESSVDISIHNVTRDIIVKPLYVCRPLVPIPYIASLNCPTMYIPGKPIDITAHVVNLGSNGTVTLSLLDNGKYTIEVKNITLIQGSSADITFTLTFSDKEVHYLYIISGNTTLAMCSIRPTSITSVYLKIIPISSITSIEDLLRSILENYNSINISNISYIKGAKIVSVLIVVNNTLGSIANASVIINGETIPLRCKDLSTDILLCNLEQPVILINKTELILEFTTTNGNTVYSNTVTITPTTQVNITKIITDWVGANELRIVIIANGLNLVTVPATIVGPGLYMSMPITFNSSGIGVINVTLNEPLLPGDNINITIHTPAKVVSSSLKAVLIKPKIIAENITFEYQNNTIPKCTLVIPRLNLVNEVTNCTFSSKLLEYTPIIVLPEGCEGVICLPYKILTIIVRPS